MVRELHWSPSLDNLARKSKVPERFLKQGYSFIPQIFKDDEGLDISPQYSSYLSRAVSASFTAKESFRKHFDAWRKLYGVGTSSISGIQVLGYLGYCHRIIKVKINEKSPSAVVRGLSLERDQIHYTNNGSPGKGYRLGDVLEDIVNKTRALLRNNLPRGIKTENKQVAIQKDHKDKIRTKRYSPLPEPDKTPINDIWTRYKKNPTTRDRNRIIEHYTSLVHSVAKGLHAKFPSRVDIEDLISDGVLGLMGAIDTFDLSRGVSFEKYSPQRIRGEILDGIRERDWVPRLVRSRTNKVGEMRDQLTLHLGRPPTEDELINGLHMTSKGFNTIRSDVGAVQVFSLSEILSRTDYDKTITPLDNTPDQNVEDPSRRASAKDFFTALSERLHLSRQEKLIIKLYYTEQMTMKQVGPVLGVSESRVSQVHGNVIERAKSNQELRAEYLQPAQV